METLIRTDDLRDGEGFDLWRSTVVRLLMPVDVRTDNDGDFQGEIRVADFGVIQTSWMRYSPLDAFRTPALIRQADPEAYNLVFSVRGSSEVNQERRSALVGAGDMTVYTSSRPFHTFSTARGPVPRGVSIVTSIPHAAMPLPPHAVARLLAVRLPAGTGLVPLLSRYLLALTTNADRYSAADTARLATVTLDLVSAMFAHQLDAERSLPPETHQRALLARIHAFVQQHLADPALTPRAVAAAHHISSRYLHRLFEQQGTTVAGWIRERRLDRCRRDLADPDLRHRPVHAVAARWGFTSAAHFSRLFRSTYGVTPSEYRLLAQRGAQR